MGQIIYTLWEQGVFSNELTVLKPLVAYICYKHEMKGKKKTINLLQKHTDLRKTI